MTHLVSIMGLLEEAQSLINSEDSCTSETLNRLLDLRSQAQGEEAAKIGLLVEDCLLKAPLEVIVEIIKANCSRLHSGWGK